jgi:hypothetical protein
VSREAQAHLGKVSIVRHQEIPEINKLIHESCPVAFTTERPDGWQESKLLPATRWFANRTAGEGGSGKLAKRVVHGVNKAKRSQVCQPYLTIFGITRFIPG